MAKAGEAHIDAVEEIDRVAEDEKRDQAPARLANSALGMILGHAPPKLVPAERALAD